MSRVILLSLVLVSAATRAEDVVVHVWETQSAGQAQSRQKAYAGASGLVTEELVAQVGGAAGGGAGAGAAASERWMRTSDFVVLADRVIMNDDSSQASMIIDPSNVPQVPGFGGAAGGDGLGALADALQQAQQALQEEGQDIPAEAQDALQNLFGGLQGLGQQAPSTALQFSSTGNTGSQDGIAWEEFSIESRGDTTIYRVADWSDVPGAELMVQHYANMGQIFERIMQNSGLGQFLQGMQSWPTELVDYMSSSRKIPIYIEEHGVVRRLIETGHDTLSDDRFGARFPVQNPFGQ